MRTLIEISHMQSSSAIRDQPSFCAPAQRCLLAVATAVSIFSSSAFFSEAADSINLREIDALRTFPPPITSISSITFTGNNVRLEFEADSRKWFFNNTLVWLNQTSVRTDKDFSLAKYDADKLITPLLNLSRKEAVTNTALLVILDPGHGGKDTGAIGLKKSKESKITLDIARRIRKKLQNPQIKVELTRNGDSTLSRPERIKLAEEHKAYLFISIHVNYADNTNASGIETYIIAGPGFPSTAGNISDKKCGPGNEFDSSNAQLAYCVHRQTLDVTGASDRGIKHARFDVLQEAPCTAILIECGFSSNPRDEASLLTRKYRQMIADGITKGILTFLNPQASPETSSKASELHSGNNREDKPN